MRRRSAEGCLHFAVYPNANALKLSHYPGLSLCLEGLKAAIRWALFDFHSS
jgi:hypothetical protein